MTYEMTAAQADDAGFRQPVPYVPVNRGKRRGKRPFTVHVRPQSTGNKARAS